jgi:CspA family cold shock protein
VIKFPEIRGNPPSPRIGGSGSGPKTKPEPPHSKITMETGTVKSFNPRRFGFGFIVTDGTKAEVFFPVREMAGSGFLRKGQKVSFELGFDRGGRPIAKNVRAV